MWYALHSSILCYYYYYFHLTDREIGLREVKDLLEVPHDQIGTGSNLTL